MTNPADFSPEVSERLYRNQRRFYRVIIWLFVAAMVYGAACNTATVIFELHAKEGRETIADCIAPDGKCAKKALESAYNRGTAIVYCQKTLPPQTTRDKVLECIIANSGR